MLKVEANKVGQTCNTLFFVAFDEILNWVIEDLEIGFSVEDILVVNVDKWSTGIKGEVMIFIEAPFGEFSKLFQRCVRTFEYFSGHESDFIFLGTSPTDDAMPFILLTLA